LRPDGPRDRPVWKTGDRMYLGNWEKHPVEDSYQWHGFGVYYRPDGQMFVGMWKDGKLSGLGKRLWCPYAPSWLKDERSSSPVKLNAAHGGGKGVVGRPFIYIGNYTGNWKEDEKAVVILKDGTTRVGPWKMNNPVGDWWKDHEMSYTSQEMLSELLDFAKHRKTCLPNRLSCSGIEESKGLEKDAENGALSKGQQRDSLSQEWPESSSRVIEDRKGPCFIGDIPSSSSDSLHWKCPPQGNQKPPPFNEMLEIINVDDEYDSGFDTRMEDDLLFTDVKPSFPISWKRPSPLDLKQEVRGVAGSRSSPVRIIVNDGDILQKNVMTIERKNNMQHKCGLGERNIICVQRQDVSGLSNSPQKVHHIENDDLPFHYLSPRDCVRLETPHRVDCYQSGHILSGTFDDGEIAPRMFDGSDVKGEGQGNVTIDFFHDAGYLDGDGKQAQRTPSDKEVNGKQDVMILFSTKARKTFDRASPTVRSQLDATCSLSSVTHENEEYCPTVVAEKPPKECNSFGTCSRLTESSSDDNNIISVIPKEKRNEKYVNMTDSDFLLSLETDERLDCTIPFYDAERLSELTKWLTEVIAFDPNMTEMERYARKLLDIGLHSVEKIRTDCTGQDIASFKWMKPFHKRRIAAWAHANSLTWYYQRVTILSNWLQDVIGYDADPVDVRFYGCQLYERGFHSVKTVQDFCSPEEIDSFHWMKPVHKRLFRSNYQNPENIETAMI